MAWAKEEAFLVKPQWQEAVKTPQDRERLKFFSALCAKAQEARAPFGEIPKVLHVIWLGPEPFPSSCLPQLRSWAARHKGWKMKYWTDNLHPAPLSQMQLCKMENFPLEEIEKIYYDAESHEERSILLRYAILESEGGVYIDEQMHCLACLEPLQKELDFFCGLDEPGQSIRSSSINPSVNLIASTQRHPICQRALQWLEEEWKEREELYPGEDGISLANRVVHRSMHALSFAIESAAGLEGRKDSVFPPEFFNARLRRIAKYAFIKPKNLFGQRIQQAKAKEKIEDTFASIRKQLRICLILIFALVALNIFLGTVIFHLYRKRKK
jgi:hypothetical protein